MPYLSAHTYFEFAPLQILPALVGALMYFVRTRTLREHHPHAYPPAWRQWCWYGGLALILATLVGPIGPISDELFSVHMAEHLLIADIGALLLVLGLTGPILQPVLAVRELRWLRVFAHPAVALPAWAINFYVWHLPALYQGAVQNDWIHGLEHIMFVSFGMAMWMALLGPLPKPAWFGNMARLVYILLVRFIETVLANVLLWAGGSFYPRYAAGERSWNVSPAADQSIAGAVMMIEGSIVTLALFCWLFLRTARQSEERQELLELAAARGVELSEQRAARAVAAGHGDVLRRRIVGEGRP